MGNRVGNGLSGRKLADEGERKGDGRVELATGDMAGRKGQNGDGEPKRKRDGDSPTAVDENVRAKGGQRLLGLCGQIRNVLNRVDLRRGSGKVQHLAGVSVVGTANLDAGAEGDGLANERSAQWRE